MLFISNIFLFLASTAGWITPENNELPIGSSAGVPPYVYENPVDFPAANQTVQVWWDSNNSGLYYAYYNGTSWITPPNNQIPLGLSSGVYGLLSPAYDPASKTLVQIWQDTANGPLYYAVYDGNTWTAPANNQIPLGAAPGALAYNQPVATDQLMLIWEGVLHGPLYYAVYDGTTWNAPANNEIPLGASGNLRFFYNPCYNPLTQQVMQVWQDTNLTHIYYSVFDGTNWSNGAAIPLGESTGVGYGAFSNPLFYPPTNQIVEIWQDNGTNMFYSVYDGTNWSTPANNEIPLGASSGCSYFAYPVYGTEQIILTWQDSVDNLLYYASYEGTKWTAPVANQIPLGESLEVYGITDPIYDNFANEVIILWEESSSDQFYFASYNGKSWTAPTQNSIPLGLSTNINVFRDPVYNTGSKQLLQIWQDFNSNNRLFYTTYNVFPPAPPCRFTGVQVKEKYLTQTERVNLLEWTASQDTTVTQYLLKRDGHLIFIGSPLGPFCYADHNRKKNKAYTYTLTVVDQKGLESAPLILTLE